MNIKLTSAKGTNLGNFRTVEGITYFNPSKQLQSALANKFPTTVEELISDDIPVSSFGDL